MPDSHMPRKVRLTSGSYAQLHTHAQPKPGDLVVIEHQGRRIVARQHGGRYLAPSGYHNPQDCHIIGVLRIPG